MSSNSEPTKLTEEYPVVPRRPDRKLRINESEWNRIVVSANRLKSASGVNLAVGCMFGGLTLSTILALVSDYRNISTHWELLLLLSISLIPTVVFIFRYTIGVATSSSLIENHKEKIAEVDEQILDRHDPLPKYTDSHSSKNEKRTVVETAKMDKQDAEAVQVGLTDVSFHRKDVEVFFNYSDLDPLRHGWSCSGGIPPKFASMIGPGEEQALSISSEGSYALDYKVNPPLSGRTIIKFIVGRQNAPTCYVRLNVKSERGANLEYWLQLRPGADSLKKLYEHGIGVPCEPVGLENNWTELKINAENALRPFFKPWSIEGIQITGFRLRDSGNILNISAALGPTITEEEAVKAILRQIKGRVVSDQSKINQYIQKLRKVDGVYRELIRLVGKEVDSWDNISQSHKRIELDIATEFYRRFLAREPENNEVIVARAFQLKKEFTEIANYDQSVDEFVDSEEYWNRFGNMIIPGKSWL